MRLGIPELIIILVIILVLFGARRLPEIGQGLGRGITNFKRAMREPPEHLDPPVDDDEQPK